MNKKTLMVCGCSFSALSLKPEYANTHFSELLALKFNYNLKNLAFQGCSNGGIRLQIDEVVKTKPDFAIIIPTFFDRTEIPVTGINPNNLTNTWQKIDNMLKEYSGYDLTRGYENINHYNSESPSLICENLTSLINNWDIPSRKGNKLSSKTVNAIKLYVTHLYDANWKKQQDRWIIEHGCLELIENGIPFLMIPTMSLWRNQEKPTLIPDKYYSTDADDCPLITFSKPEYSLGDITGREYLLDPGYHTNLDGQIYLANRYKKIIKERWNIL